MRARSKHRQKEAMQNPEKTHGGGRGEEKEEEEEIILFQDLMTKNKTNQQGKNTEEDLMIEDKKLQEEKKIQDMRKEEDLLNKALMLCRRLIHDDIIEEHEDARRALVFWVWLNQIKEIPNVFEFLLNCPKYFLEAAFQEANHAVIYSYISCWLHTNNNNSQTLQYDSYVCAHPQNPGPVFTSPPNPCNISTLPRHNSGTAHIPCNSTVFSPIPCNNLLYAHPQNLMHNVPPPHPENLCGIAWPPHPVAPNPSIPSELSSNPQNSSNAASNSQHSSPCPLKLAKISPPSLFFMTSLYSRGEKDVDLEKEVPSLWPNLEKYAKSLFHDLRQRLQQQRQD